MDEVARWAFEVWNEPNLEVFWTGTPGRLPAPVRRGGPRGQGRRRAAARRRPVHRGVASGSRRWRHTPRRTSVPLDFVTTHTYGNLPLDIRPALEPARVRRHPDLVDGVGRRLDPLRRRSTTASSVRPSCSAASHAVQGRLDALAYWVISDHFEELGRPPALFHNGFGLLTVGNLRKPRYWARPPCRAPGRRACSAAPLDGDGADVLVQAWATRHDDGTVDVLLWNGTINAALMDGDARLDRVVVSCPIHGPARPPRTRRRWRGSMPSTPTSSTAHTDGADWPDAEGWKRLHAADELFEERLPDVTPQQGADQLRDHAAPAGRGTRALDPRRHRRHPASRLRNHGRHRRNELMMNRLPRLRSALLLTAAVALATTDPRRLRRCRRRQRHRRLGVRRADHPGRRRQPDAGGELQPVSRRRSSRALG